MVNRGGRKSFGKNLGSNSAKPLTVTALTALVWVTRSYDNFPDRMAAYAAELFSMSNNRLSGRMGARRE